MRGDYAYTDEMRLLPAVAASLLIWFPQSASAQTAEPPRLEIGGQVSAQTGEPGSATWTPRLSLNLRPDTALEFSGDFRQASSDPFRHSEVDQTAALHFRQTLWENDRWQLFGVVGGGVRRSVSTFPHFRFVDWNPAVHIGPAVQARVAKRLVLRADVRLSLTETSGLRGMIGAAVPIGHLPAGTRARQRPGDSLVNGVAIGTSVGAVTGALTGAFLAAVLCEGDCADNGVAFVAVTAATGTGIGGLLGAIIDAFKR